MIRSTYPLLALAGLVICADAVPVTNWVATNGDASFTAGTAATSSPVTTSADADTIAGAFPAVTLPVGESITLTGTINITGNTGTIPGNQLRWALFNSPGVPTTGQGSNYVGVWVSAPASGAANLVTANGTTTNPFSGSATTVVSSASDVGGQTPRFGTTLSVSLTITRLNATQISSEATLTDNADLLIEWPATTSPASPSSFTYNSAAFLLGGSLNATTATLDNIEVTVTQPAADTDGDGMPDDFEILYGLNPNLDDAALDLDSDTLTNLQEYRGADGSPGTGDETFPNDTDSDDDTVIDGTELTNGTNPLNPDSDNDGLSDAVETNTSTFVDTNDTGTDPLDSDSDNDGASDGEEVNAGTNPNDAASKLGDHFLAIDFNRNDALGAPSQSKFRIIAGSATQADNAASYLKKFGPTRVAISQPDGTNFEFRGANTDPSRAIPGGDTSLSFLVADLIGTREGSLEITFTDLPAGNYLFKSFHLSPFNLTNLGFAQGATPTTQNTIEARIGASLLDSVQPTALGSSGLNTTFINNSHIPTIAFPVSHDGLAPLTITLTSTENNGTASFLFLNGFQLFQTSAP